MIETKFYNIEPPADIRLFYQTLLSRMQSNPNEYIPSRTEQISLIEHQIEGAKLSFDPNRTKAPISLTGDLTSLFVARSALQILTDTELYEVKE